MKRIGLLFISFIICCCTLAAQTLAERLDAVVSSDKLLATSEVGISVFNLTQGKQVYAYQDKKLYRPASIEKLITSVTALAELGEYYVFNTRVAYTGTITQDSVLQGDLYVVGGFDPEFMDEDMNKLAEAVHNSGIRSIQGRLVADVSLTDSIYWGPGWSWDDTPESFQPYLSPLMLNRGCVNVTVIPGTKGKRPQVEVVPESDYYTVCNLAKSYLPQEGKLKVTRNWLDNGNTIYISGNANYRCTKKLNMYASQDFFLHTFAYKLNKKRISVQAVSYGMCPDEATGLYTLSHPLTPVLKRALKKSDNLSAEALFYHLGIHHSDEKYVGYKDAQNVIYDFMKNEIGYNPDDYSIVDGSGVSLYNYISPALMMEYLKYAYSRAEIFRPLYEALPIAGVDGTLGNRMKKGRAYRNVHAKTGTVTGVSSLAGYVKAGNGDMLAFVIINQNVLKGKDARLFQDKICEILTH